MTQQRVVSVLPAEVAQRWRADRGDGLMFLVLYDRPRDQPEHCVLRPQYTDRGSGQLRVSRLAMLYPNFLAAQAFVDRFFPDLVYMPRLAGDEPQIVGCWM